jgi:hypothetical protein
MSPNELHYFHCVCIPIACTKYIIQILVQEIQNMIHAFFLNHN